MQQTDKYQFKLIEGSDHFSWDQINQNVKKTEELFAALPKLHIQPYTGDGQTSRTHTFPFKPKLLLFIRGFDSKHAPMPLIPGQEWATGSDSGYNEMIYLTWPEDGRSVQLRSDNPDRCLNYNNSKYVVVVFG